MNRLASKDYKRDIFGDVDNGLFPAPVELLHVSITHAGPGVDDLIRFYATVLNMRFVYKISYPEFEFIALSHDDENHRIGIVNSLSGKDDALAIAQGVDLSKDVQTGRHALDPRDAPLRQCRIEHTSWRLPRFEDVLITAKRVHDELDLWPRSSRLTATDITIDYNDPDGNRVELLTQARSKAQILLALEHRYAQPRDGVQYSDIYQSFSMAKMLAMYEAGEQVRNLRDRAWVKQRVEEGRL